MRRRFTMRLSPSIWSLAANLVFAATAIAQPAPFRPSPPTSSAHVGVLENPCAALTPTPPAVLAFVAEGARARVAHQPAPKPTPDMLQSYNSWQQRLRLSDFAGRCHYDAANAALPPATGHRVVFFGASIVELWGSTQPDLFRNDFIDRGLAGQTTMQMLDRFRADVIDLHPQVVHIIAGTNDIAGNTGPIELRWLEANFETMVELAQAHHIRVVLGALPPSARFPWQPDLTPAATIVAFDRWMADYARRKGLTFVDYHQLFEDGQGGFRAGLSEDGVHPTPAGYALMRPLAERAIATALATPAP